MHILGEQERIFFEREGVKNTLHVAHPPVCKKYFTTRGGAVPGPKAYE